MSRLASAARAHFYPCQPAVVAQIAAHIAAPHGGRMWDPCAGEGAALAQLASLLGLEPFGNELHQGRATTAAAAVEAVVDSTRTLAHRDRQLTRVFAASVYDMRVAHNAFTLLYLNPPFDYDAKEKRLELSFLKATRQSLAQGGLLVWVIPQRVLRVEKAATYLASWFDDLRVLRFPDDSRQYKQTVVFGVHRGNRRSRQPDAETVAWLRQCGRLGDELTAIDTVEPVLSPAEAPVLSSAEAPFSYTLPAVVMPSAKLRFEPQRVDRALLQREMAAHGVLTLSAWHEQTAPAGDGQKAFRPLTPMRQGHILNLIAAGYLDNMSLQRQQTVLMLKGQAYKQTKQQESAETDEDGNTTLTTTYTEQFQVRIKTLEPDGSISTLEGEQLHSFMADWLTPITDRLVAQYAPVYTFDLNGYKPVLDTLNQQRTIPNTDMRGLAPAQQHAVAAAATRLDRRYQDEQDAIIVGEMGTGKAQPLTANVLTPGGWQTMGDLAIGDAVIDPEGGTATVVGIFPQGVRPVYRVWMSDGSSTECCAEHLWAVNTPERKFRDHPRKVLPLKALRDRLFSQSNNARYFIPLATAVEFPPAEHPLDPYVLGALIGDGSIKYNRAQFTTNDSFIVEQFRSILPDAVRVGKLSSKCSYSCATSPKGAANPILDGLRMLGLSGCGSETKFIPNCYKQAPRSARIALLQGLMDTDGTVGKAGCNPSYTTVSPQLADDVVELVQSLGGIATVVERVTHYTHKGEYRTGRKSYRITLRLPPELIPFRLPRKRTRYRQPTKYMPTRAIVAVEYVGEKATQCIALDSANQLYITDEYIVTHNTVMGPAIAACVEAARTIVLCPPHLVAKWKREILHVVPWARVMALKTISDVDTFFNQPASAAEPVFGVMKETTARSASGWEHAYDWCGPVRQKPAKRGSPAQATASSALVNAFWEHADTFRKLPDDEKQAYRVPIERGDKTHNIRYMALWRYLTTRRPICDPTTGIAIMTGDRPITPADFKRKQLLQQGNPLYSATRRRSAKQEAQRITLKDALRRQTILQTRLRAGLEPYDHGVASSASGHDSALHSSFLLPPSSFSSGSAKWPLATYIKQRYAGRLDLLQADEAHEYKGHDSDRGYAFARLVRAAQKVLLLTGTIYGGKASTLFSLLYRSTTDLRQVYGHRAVAAWVRQYGVLQEIVKTKLDANGKQTGNKRNKSTVRELPGASPALVRWLLDRSVFIGLEDLGFALPAYDERPQLVEMTPAMAERYASLLGQLKAAITECLLRGDHSLLGGYLQALITWPDTPWRGKTVVHPRTGEVVASVPPLDMLPGEAPKEAELVARIQQELAAGRRILLLCQQTETLDITPQWVDLLDRHGIKSAVLRCDPAKREAWIARQEAAGTDVIITHPRRVQTGLDILGFPVVMWMGTEYSVYTIRQTNRRPYRIGQTEDVTVDFWAYADTLQEHALRLIASKMTASYQIDGELVTDNAMTDLGHVGDDLVQMLARIVVGGDQPATTESLSDAFAQANRATASYRRFIGTEQPELAAANGNGRDKTGQDVIRPKQTIIQPAAAPVLQQDALVRPETVHTNGYAAAVDALIRPKNSSGTGISNGVATHANGHENKLADIRPKVCRARSEHSCRAMSKQPESSEPQPPPTSLFDLFQQYEQGEAAAHDA